MDMACGTGTQLQASRKGAEDVFPSGLLLAVHPSL